MKSRTIVTAIASMLLLGTGFVPVSSAQDVKAPEAIEVITITAKRPTSTLATACVRDALATSARQHGAGHFSEQESRATDSINLRQALQHCREQAES